MMEDDDDDDDDDDDTRGAVGMNDRDNRRITTNPA
jgi:hypothetical protein